MERVARRGPPRRGKTSAGDGVGRARDPLPAQLRFGILQRDQRDGFRCRYCGRPGSAPGVVLHVKHVVPLVAGGATTEDNLLTACEECNLGKGTRAVVLAGSQAQRGGAAVLNRTALPGVGGQFDRWSAEGAPPCLCVTGGSRTPA